MPPFGRLHITLALAVLALLIGSAEAVQMVLETGTVALRYALPLPLILIVLVDTIARLRSEARS
jgi:hypothetical protein